MHTGHNCIRVLEGSLLTVVFIVENLDLVSIYLPLLPSLSSLSSSTSLSPFSLSVTSKFHHSHKVEHSDLIPRVAGPVSPLDLIAFLVSHSVQKKVN